ncbi:MFS transporter [Priestia megaterium]|uniref:MFS transporter n=1 Tax=Priestia megaterium TaxID=1404 RepID=UPI0011A6B4C5|nr:MFS transporter [Priestia megaterium]MCM3019231.1 MFS transporter [Priestia megaterium]
MFSKRPLSVLLISTLSMIIAFSVWSVLAPIAADIQVMYSLTNAEKSILIATPVLLGSLMRIPMGILTDRFGGRKVYSLTMLALLLPTICAGFTHSYSMLLFWAFFIGMAGTTFAISITYVSKWYSPQKQGFILGIAGMGNLGSAVASFSIPLIFSSFGLPWVFWSLAIAVALMALLLWVGTSDHPSAASPKTLQESLSVLKFKETWFLSVFYFLTFGGFVTFSIYLPTILHDQFNASTVDSGLKTAVFVVLATFVRPLGGYLSDVCGAKKVLTFVFTGMLLIGLFIAFTITAFSLFSVGCLLAAITLGIGNGAVFKMVPSVSTGNIGAVTGIVGAFGGVGGFFPPIVLGFIKDTSGDYVVGFSLLALFALFCLLLNYSGFKKQNVRINQKHLA